MNARRSLKTQILAASVVMALAQFGAPARADSGAGHDTVLGNALSPRGVNPSTHGEALDPDGMGTRTPAARTPTGQMYDMPVAPVEDVSKTAAGWEYFGYVEAGVLGTDGDRKSAGYRRYKDADSGLHVLSFGLSMEKRDAARYFELSGGGVARDDQFYGVRFGRYNDWKVSAFLHETPQVYTTTFRSIYDGIGSGNLTLKAGLTPGGTASTATDKTNVAAVANANAGTELGVVRTKGGVRLDKTLSERWKFFASYTSERREGSRPFGSVWLGGGGTAPVETVEPVDYNSHDLIAGLHYADERNALNLQLAASWFRNDIDTLTFQVPFRVSAATVNGIAPGGFTQGRFDLYPNNEYYNVKGEYARSLPEFYKGRFTAVVALASSRQNDTLTPYAPMAGVTLANVTVNNWNSAASLSRPTADARIDTRLADLGLAANPAKDLSLKAKLRYYETRNHTEFLACNPNSAYVDNDPNTAGNQAGGLNAFGCNGVWGRPINDGSGSAALMGASAVQAGNLNIRSIPFDYRQWNYSLAGDYRLSRASSLNAAWERETFRRDHREREKTWEDKFKLGYVHRGLENATLRVSLGHDRRRGSDYHTHHPYAEFYSGAIVPIPTAAAANVQSWAVHMNAWLRKYDLADRNQSTLNARLNYLARADLDLGIAAQLKDIRYPDSALGRTDKQTAQSLNFDATWQASAERSLHAFFSHQEGRMSQKGMPSGAIAAGAIGPATAVLGCAIGVATPLGTITAANAEDICADPASNAVWLAVNGWSANHKDVTDALGFGWKEQIGKLRLDLTYNYADSKTAIGYTPPPSLALASVALAGNGMPDLRTAQHIFQANLLVPINKTLSARLLLRHEVGKVRDWHYAGFEATPVVAATAGGLPTAVILDAGPQNYKASLLGAMLIFRM